MNRIENGMNTTNGLSTETHNLFSTHYGLWQGKCLKCILTYLDCPKYNEINIDHSYIQNHVSHKK